jgi:fatty acid-binding protein DegV
MLNKMPQVLKVAYQCPEVGYLEGRIVARDTRNFVVPPIDLESRSAFNQNQKYNARMVGEPSYQGVRVLSCHFVAYSGKLQVEGIERFVEAGQELAPGLCPICVYSKGVVYSCCVAALERG